MFSVNKNNETTLNQERDQYNLQRRSNGMGSTHGRLRIVNAEEYLAIIISNEMNKEQESLQ